jgi:hypothetical protein
MDPVPSQKHVKVIVKIREEYDALIILISGKNPSCCPTALDVLLVVIIVVVVVVFAGGAPFGCALLAAHTPAPVAGDIAGVGETAPVHNGPLAEVRVPGLHAAIARRLRVHPFHEHKGEENQNGHDSTCSGEPSHVNALLFISLKKRNKFL